MKARRRQPCEAGRLIRDRVIGMSLRPIILAVAIAVSLTLASCGAGNLTGQSSSASSSTTISALPNTTALLATTTAVTASTSVGSVSQMITPTASPTPGSEAASSLISSSSSPTTSGLGSLAPAPTVPAGLSSLLAPATATAMAPIANEVLRAWSDYLRVYQEAMRNLDPTHLTDVMAGDALQRITDEVNQLASQNRPVMIIETDHHVAIVQLSNSAATLADEFLDGSEYVDAKSGQPIKRTTPPDQVLMTYQFRKIGTTWKVIKGTVESVNGTPVPSASVTP
jgi:hypothetical protein